MCKYPELCVFTRIFVFLYLNNLAFYKRYRCGAFPPTTKLIWPSFLPSVSQAVHLASAHGLDPANAKEVEEARTGKSAARTDLTLDFVIQRKRFQQQLLNEEKI